MHCISRYFGDALAPLALLVLVSVPAPLGAQEVRRGHVAADGARVYYEVRGSGEPVVLIHGGFMDRRMWDPQFEALSSRFTVVRYDLRGAGRTEIDARAPYSPLRDLVAVLDHLGIERAAIAGLSAGGFIAIDFALAYPERVSALIAAETLPRGFPLSPEILRSMATVMETLTQYGRDSAVAVFLTQPVFATAVDTPELAERLRRMLHDNLEWPVPPRLPDPPAMAHLGDISVPVLIVLGETSGADAHRAAEIMVRDIPHATVVRIPGAGHMVNLEAPEAFNQSVTRFLEGLSGR